jgi:hypothetical protein
MPSVRTLTVFVTASVTMVKTVSGASDDAVVEVLLSRASGRRAEREGEQRVDLLRVHLRHPERRRAGRQPGVRSAGSS